MLEPLDSSACGPSVTVPAGNVLVKTSKVRGVLSLSVSCVPESVQLASSQGSFPSRVSTATATVAGALIVNVASGFSVADLEPFAVWIQPARSARPARRRP